MVQNVQKWRENGLKTQTFLKGSVILIVSAVLTKGLGALFKIPLTNQLGGVGMGYFSCAYGLFLPVYALSITGLSTAVATLVAKENGCGRYRNVRKIRRTARLLFTGIGLLLAVLIWLLAEPFASYTAADPAAAYAVRMMAPAALFGCFTAVERGYYEGLCNMYPTAVSQAVEAVAKLACGLLLSRYVFDHAEQFRSFFPAGTELLPVAAAAAVLGVTLSTLCGGLYFAVRNLAGDGIRKAGLAQHQETERTGTIFRSLFRIMLPVALGSVVTNLTSLIDLCTMMRCFDRMQQTQLPELVQKFGDAAKDTAFPALVYGSFTGMALTVFNLVPSVTNMFGKSALPCAAQAWAKQQKQAVAEQLQSVLFVTALLALPASGGLFCMAEPVMQVLYSGRETECAIAAESLQALMPGMLFLCLTMPLFSILQGIGRADLPVKYMLPCVAVKLVGNLIFLRIPSLCLTGAGIATSLSYFLLFCLSLHGLRRILGVPLHWLKPLLPLCYASAMSIVTACLFRNLTASMPLPVMLLSAVGSAVVMYGVVLLLLEKTAFRLREGLCLRVY